MVKGRPRQLPQPRIAPASVQRWRLHHARLRLADSTQSAVILTDGFVADDGTARSRRIEIQAPTTLAVKGTPETRANLISSIFLESDELEAHQIRMEAKYIRAQKAEQRCELCYNRRRRDSVVGYGIVSRVLLSTVEACAKTA